jgi:hypothetical protein
VFFVRQCISMYRYKLKEISIKVRNLLGGSFMSKESKLLLFAIILSTLVVVGAQYYFHSRLLVLAAKAQGSAVQVSPSPVVTQEASASAVPKVKLASPSAAPKKTVAPTAIPEPATEPAPSE